MKGSFDWEQKWRIQITNGYAAGYAFNIFEAKQDGFSFSWSFNNIRRSFGETGGIDSISPSDALFVLRSDVTLTSFRPRKFYLQSRPASSFMPTERERQRWNSGNVEVIKN